MDINFTIKFNKLDIFLFCANIPAYIRQISEMKKGEITTILIEKIAYKGIGIGYIEQPDKRKIVTFVPDTVPGDTVQIRIIKNRKTYIEAKKLEIVSTTAKKIQAPCPSFGVCGGCMWQNIPYETQLEYKKGFITESLEHIGNQKDLPEIEMFPSPEQYNYRNKIELSFGNQRYLAQDQMQNLPESVEGTYVGYHGRGSFYKIVDIDTCKLVTPVFDDILKCLKDFVKQKKLPPYNVHDHTGFMRHIVLRHGINTGEFMLHIITASTEDYSEEFWKPLVDNLLLLENDDVKMESILWTQNDSISDIVQGTPKLLYGREYIFDKVGDFLFKISPYSFFQTNTKGAEVLYDVVKKQCDLKGGEVVIDLYAGTGTIGMYLAKSAKKIFSVEENKGAVEDARTNAVLNNIMNIEFYCGKVEKDAFPLIFERPNVVVIDPPRAGMHPKALEMLPKFGSEKLIYVSCNPTTLARDLAYLTKWYKVERIIGVDMFPQTYHIETVCTLVKK